MKPRQKLKLEDSHQPPLHHPDTASYTSTTAYQQWTMSQCHQSPSKSPFIRPSICGSLCSPAELQPNSAPSPLLFSCLIQAFILSLASTSVPASGGGGDVSGPHPELLIQGYCGSHLQEVNCWDQSAKTLIYSWQIKLSNWSLLETHKLIELVSPQITASSR